MHDVDDDYVLKTSKYVLERSFYYYKTLIVCWISLAIEKQRAHGMCKCAMILSMKNKNRAF